MLEKKGNEGTGNYDQLMIQKVKPLIMDKIVI